MSDRGDHDFVPVPLRECRHGPPIETQRRGGNRAGTGFLDHWSIKLRMRERGSAFAAQPFGHRDRCGDHLEAVWASPSPTSDIDCALTIGKLDLSIVEILSKFVVSHPLVKEVIQEEVMK